MNLDDLQQHALKSIVITQKDVTALAHRSLGLTGEAGILANQLKKVIRDKNGVASDEDLEVIKKRLGDVLYYTAALAEYFGMSLSEVASANMQRSSDFAKSRNIK